MPIELPTRSLSSSLSAHGAGASPASSQNAGQAAASAAHATSMKPDVVLRGGAPDSSPRLISAQPESRPQTPGPAADALGLNAVEYAAFKKTLRGAILGGTAITALGVGLALMLEYFITEGAIKNGVAAGLKKAGPLQIQNVAPKETVAA